jgi:hypothetical protein
MGLLVLRDDRFQRQDSGSRARRLGQGERGEQSVALAMSLNPAVIAKERAAKERIEAERRAASNPRADLRAALAQQREIALVLEVKGSDNDYNC